MPKIGRMRERPPLISLEYEDGVKNHLGGSRKIAPFGLKDEGIQPNYWRKQPYMTDYEEGVRHCIGGLGEEPPFHRLDDYDDKSGRHTVCAIREKPAFLSDEFQDGRHSVCGLSPRIRMSAYYAGSPMPRSARSATPIGPELSQLLPSIADRTVMKTMGMNNTRSYEVSHAKNYYNPVRSAVYNRFSPSDWAASNKANFTLSDKERSFANRLRAECFQAVKTTEARTRNRQQDTTKKLGERVQDVYFWKSELQRELYAMAHEISSLQESKRLLERALDQTNGPLHVAEECLLHREKREGIDQVRDDVERSLIKEVELIKRCQSKMRKMIDRAAAQLKMNRAAQHELDKDAKDKNHAQGLDDRMHQLHNSSQGLGYHPGIEDVDNTISIPVSWVRFTQENIARSQKCRAMSESLRGEIDALLRACASEMWSQSNNVNNALETRAQETTQARNKLQGHLQKTMQEIFDMEKNIELLRHAIHMKEAPLKVAMTRLEERTRRLNVEICRDPAMLTLQREINEIKESIRMLKERLKLSERALHKLLQVRATLERDIGVKENSLLIDGRSCLGMRKTFPMDPKLGPVYSMPM